MKRRHYLASQACCSSMLIFRTLKNLWESKGNTFAWITTLSVSRGGTCAAGSPEPVTEDGATAHACPPDLQGATSENVLFRRHRTTAACGSRSVHSAQILLARGWSTDLAHSMGSDAVSWTLSSPQAMDAGRAGSNFIVMPMENQPDFHQVLPKFLLNQEPLTWNSEQE